VIGRKERPTRKGLIGLLWVIFVRVRVCERPTFIVMAGAFDLKV
jgi:hypothetical protein